MDGVTVHWGEWLDGISIAASVQLLVHLVEAIFLGKTAGGLTRGDSSQAIAHARISVVLGHDVIGAGWSFLVINMVPRSLRWVDVSALSLGCPGLMAAALTLRFESLMLAKNATIVRVYNIATTV